MNATMRKELRKAIGLLEDIAPKLDEACAIVESAAQEMRAKFEALSEKAQEGERGHRINWIAEALETALSDLEQLALQDVIENIDNAASE